MKERPVIFSTESVKAILAGSKTQTRRVLKQRPLPVVDYEKQCPYGQVGDRLWVRETYWIDYLWDKDRQPDRVPAGDKPHYIHYKADDHLEVIDRSIPWKPSIFMPRWASRILLEITDIRVERLQEITRGDAMAEGYPNGWCYMNRGDETDWFAYVWDSLNIKRGYGWQTNPWVWVISFNLTKEEQM